MPWHSYVTAAVLVAWYYWPLVAKLERWPLGQTKRETRRAIDLSGGLKQ